MQDDIPSQCHKLIPSPKEGASCGCVAMLALIAAIAQAVGSRFVNSRLLVVIILGGRSAAQRSFIYWLLIELLSYAATLRHGATCINGCPHDV